MTKKEITNQQKQIKNILSTPQPVVSEYLEWITYSIYIHEIDESFEPIKEKLLKSLSESYGTLADFEKMEFKTMCKSNVIHILTHCNYKKENVYFQQRCDQPLLHMYLVSNSDNDGAKRVRTMIKDNTTKNIQVMILCVGGDNKSSRRFNKETNEIVSYNLQPQKADYEVQIKELMSYISKCVVNNYEIYMKEYKEETSILPNTKIIDETKRYASLCFEASILSQKVGDFTTALEFLDQGLNELDITGKCVEEDVKRFKNSAVNVNEIYFKRNVEQINPQTVYTASNRLDCFIQLLYRMINMYLAQGKYSELIKEYIKCVQMMAKHFEIVQTKGIVIPYLFKELFMIDCYDYFLDEIYKRHSFIKKNDIIFIYLHKMFTMKSIGEQLFIFDNSPDFLHFDVDFANKEPLLPERVTLPNCRNKTLIEIIRKKNIFDKEFELILKNCIDHCSEYFNRNGSLYIFKKLLGLFYFESNRRDEAKQIFKEILLSKTCDNVTKSFCCIASLQCEFDLELYMIVYSFLLTNHKEDVYNIYKQMYKQNPDTLQIVEKKMIQTKLIELIEKNKNEEKKEIDIILPDFITLFDDHVTQRNYQISFESHFDIELKNMKVELFCQNKLRKQTISVSDVSINSKDISSLIFSLPLVGLITITQLKFHLDEYVSISVPLKRSVLVRTTREQFSMTIETPQFIPLGLEDWNGSVKLKINIIEPVEYISVDFNSEIPTSSNVKVTGAECETIETTYMLTKFEGKEVTVEYPMTNEIENGDYDFDITAVSPLYLNHHNEILSSHYLIDIPSEGNPVMRNGRLLITIPILNVCPFPLHIKTISFADTEYTLTIDELIPKEKTIHYTIDVTGLEKTLNTEILIQFDNGILKMPYVIQYSPPSYNVRIEVPKIVRCSKPFQLTAIIQSNRKEDELIIVKVDKTQNIILSGYEKQQMIIPAGETIVLKYECIAMTYGNLNLPNISLSGERNTMHVAYEKDIQLLTVLPLQSNFYAFTSLK